MKVKAGSGGLNSGRNYYIKGHSGANATEVRLTAENNNYSSSSYSVKGYRDEETGRILPGQYLDKPTNAIDEEGVIQVYQIFERGKRTRGTHHFDKSS
ncbi:DUF2712 domain-containing protein [Bacillus sp. ISL-4]|nr:DUF2712 domain-containing protein [Bacillus sp. ISL-4]MBT2667450.1 DUF2712 domain-containing protein [Bacillus sp. ISL-4]MBT2673266.1 DUF2712 domain-containing protein [Streptomyces sp. ISL-14]